MNWKRSQYGGALVVFALFVSGCSGSSSGSRVSELDDTSESQDETQDIAPDIISIDNYQELLKEVVSSVNRTTLEDVVQNRPTEFGSLASSETLLEIELPQPVRLLTNVLKQTSNCTSGGSRILYADANGNPNVDSAVFYENCTSSDGSVYNGMVSNHKGDPDYVFYNLRRSSIDSDLSTSLQYKASTRTPHRVGINYTRTISDLEYLEQVGDLVTSLADYSLTHSYVESGININTTGTEQFGYGLGSPGAFIVHHVSNMGSLISEFVLSSQTTLDRPVHVNISIEGKSNAIFVGNRNLSIAEFKSTIDFDPNRLEFPYTQDEEPWYWRTGAFTVTANDGSRLALANFRVDGFDVELFDKRGSHHSTVPLQWTNGYNIKCNLRSDTCNRVDSD